MTFDKYKAIATSKATVCDGAFDILQRVEFSKMAKRAETEGVESVDNGAARVRVHLL